MVHEPRRPERQAQALEMRQRLGCLGDECPHPLRVQSIRAHVTKIGRGFLDAVRAARGGAEMIGADPQQTRRYRRTAAQSGRLLQDHASQPHGLRRDGAKQARRARSHDDDVELFRCHPDLGLAPRICNE
jgi:hypothetical protein